MGVPYRPPFSLQWSRFQQMSKTYFERLDSCKASTKHLREQLGIHGNERGKEETPEPIFLSGRR